MEKRFILFIALSVFVILLWSSLSPKQYHIENKEVTSTSPQPATQTLPTLQLSKTNIPEHALAEAPPSQLLDFSQGKFTVTFSEPLAAIKEITFKEHQGDRFGLRQGFLISDPELKFRKASSSPDTIVFEHRDVQKAVTKAFVFSNSNYTIDLEIKIQNLSSSEIKVNLPLVLGDFDFSRQNQNAAYQSITVSTPEKVLHTNAQKNQDFGAVNFMGLRSRYFCLVIQPENNRYTGQARKLNGELEAILTGPEILLKPKEQIGQKFSIYLGPQDLKLINKINPSWGAIINYGTFDFISQMLLQLLELLHRIVRNWGWAITLLSLIVFILLLPLTIKQFRSMKEMQVLQPKIEALREMYKDNQQKLHKETMQLYREHKVNPFGSCLVPILQIPVFIALYQALMRSIYLKGESFFWIKDLSLPDQLFTLPSALPVIGKEINILPILMAIAMFLQQRLSLAGASGTAKEQQKLMSILMPVLFGAFFYHMPAGLVLYWFVNTGLMLIYQLKANQGK